MHLAHVNIATLPVFGWTHLEPEEGVYTFEWLDQILAKLHDGGVSLCLATATASVPAWMDRKYPGHSAGGQQRPAALSWEPALVSARTRPISGGCPPRLRAKWRSVMPAHPGLLVWHVGNEYSGTCYCGQCAAAFRLWLKARYGSLDTLNERWYAAFWGHTYGDWELIEPPTFLGERSLPALLIDYDRFQSQSLLNCFVAERDAIRAHSSDVPITTNLMGAFKPLDYRKWAAEMDIVSWDSYPAWGAAPAEIAFSHSLMRGLKDGQPWMLMEQTPSQQNWQAYNSLKRPGVARLWSYQAMAHGADAVMYFQWRRGRGGIEKLHGAIVEHARGVRMCGSSRRSPHSARSWRRLERRQ